MKIEGEKKETYKLILEFENESEASTFQVIMKSIMMIADGKSDVILPEYTKRIAEMGKKFYDKCIELWNNL